MFGRTSLPQEKSSLPRQVPTDVFSQAALDPFCAQRKAWFLLAGIAVAALVLIGVSDSVDAPLASSVSTKTSHDSPAVIVVSSQDEAFISPHPLPALIPGHTRPAVSGLRRPVLPGVAPKHVPPTAARPVVFLYMYLGADLQLQTSPELENENSRKRKTTAPELEKDKSRKTRSPAPELEKKPMWTQRFEEYPMTSVNKQKVVLSKVKKPMWTHRFEEYPMTSVNKQKVVLSNVLGSWLEQTIEKESQAVETRDVKGASSMLSDQTIIKKLQKEIEMNVIDHHVFGVVAIKASGHTMQAITSVSLRFESDPDDKLQGMLQNIAKEQGLQASLTLPFKQVPLVHIGELVTAPDETPERARGALIQAILQYAKGLGRFVAITPATDALVDYYFSLGFRRIDEIGSTTMVYCGDQMEDTLLARV